MGYFGSRVVVIIMVFGGEGEPSAVVVPSAAPSAVRYPGYSGIPPLPGEGEWEVIRRQVDESRRVERRDAERRVEDRNAEYWRRTGREPVPYWDMPGGQ